MKSNTAKILLAAVCVLPLAASTALAEDKEKDKENDNAGEYIQIPAGSLVLSHHTAGNPTGHTVKLDAFALKKTPVTVAEFEKCAAAGKCSKEHYKTAAEMASCNYNRGGDWNSHPMNCVDWYGAKEFCEWSGGRLPTEDEWEYASAHDGRENFKAKYPWAGQYPWGSRKPDPSIANFGGNVGTTTAVGKYSPAGDSRLGLVDMSGNVWEWTFSVSPRDKENKSYVIRGGSWKTSADRVRVTFGIEASPAHMDGELGLRCVKPMVSGTTAAAPGNNNRIQKQNEYIHIPGGSFVLSHNTGKYRKKDTVALNAFELKQTPVTVAEFQKCAAAGACRAENYDAFLEHAGCNYNRGDDYLDHPMNCVNMAGAKEYCEWSGGRLPTEEEWEYAATHDGAKHLDTKYPWGNKDPDKSTANYLLDYYTGETTPVGRYSPAGDSPLGLVDMSGNVWEWTDSFYEFGASSGKALRVLKSDAYCASYGPKWDLLVTNRTSGEPKNRGKPIGFRCVKTKAAGNQSGEQPKSQGAAK